MDNYSRKVDHNYCRPDPRRTKKLWLDKMIKEGKIAVPPGRTGKGSSIRCLSACFPLHNAMEEQKRQEAMDMDDEDDE
ncbi:MAG: hypothetical protein U0361_14890 [Nitrospiraceae bacterium]